MEYRLKDNSHDIWQALQAMSKFTKTAIFKISFRGIVVC